MKTDLLLILADRLEHDVPEGQWDFGHWGLQKECGFVGCAIGWAAQWPEFKGLEIQSDEGLNEGLIFPVCDGTTGTHAVAKFFGLRELDAATLFADTILYGKAWEHVTPADVAVAIRKFVGAVPAPEIKIQEKVRIND